MTITRSPGGVRRVVVERADHTVIVTNGAGRGYVQRPFSVRGRPYVQRTVFANHMSHVRVYRPYTYGPVTLHVYAPVRYYSPAFYGWAYSPWGEPVHYGWGWAGNPWHRYYGFTPYPVYASPSLWLTDYLIATTLQDAYEERRAAAAEARAEMSNASPDGEVVLTPEVKEAIAEEVQRQIGQERAEAQANAQNFTPSETSGLPTTLAGDTHVFVVSRGLDVMADGKECAITEGDVLRLKGEPSPNAGGIRLLLLASKRQDCRQGSFVTVQLQDLVEMQNQMRETLDRGLEDLQSNQGQSGLPALSEAAAAAPMQAFISAEQPPMDHNVSDEIRQGSQQADQTLREVASQTASPLTISRGQTIDEVEASLGAPQTVVDLGKKKKIYVYSDMKITFTKGKVSDVL